MKTSSHIRLPDLIAESLAGILQRPGRSALTILGTVLGIGTFVAVLGLTTTVGGQVDKRFTELAATEVSVEDLGTPDEAYNPMSFQQDSSERISRLNGVVQAGVWWQIPSSNLTVGSTPVTSEADRGISLLAAEPSAVHAMRPTISEGRLFDHFHADRAEQVALLGRSVATRLGISRLDGSPAIFVDGLPFTVIGILDDVVRRPEVLLSIVIPANTALALFSEPVSPRAQMLIEVELGAAKLIATQAPLALRPEEPSRFKAITPINASGLHRNVTGDLNSFFLVLAAISLLIGALGIANTTLVAVLERVGEIGLRRALGATPRHIAAQFLTESTVLGFVGGLIGTGIATTVVIGISLAQQWTPILTHWTVLPAPAAGALIGVLAGAYPSLRAASIPPIQALRR